VPVSGVDPQIDQGALSKFTQKAGENGADDVMLLLSVASPP